MHANLVPRACPFAGAKTRVEYTIKPAHSQQIAGFNTEAELYISYLILILHNFNKTRDGLLWLGWVVPMPGNCCKIDKQSISKIRISRRKSDPSGPSVRSVRPSGPSVRSVRPVRPSGPSVRSVRPVRPSGPSVRSVRPVHPVRPSPSVRPYPRFILTLAQCSIALYSTTSWQYSVHNSKFNGLYVVCCW
jgi:hypothetical protein